MANAEKVGVRYIKDVPAKDVRNAFGRGRSEGEVTYLPEAEANELVRTGVARLLKAE